MRTRHLRPVHADLPTISPSSRRGAALLAWALLLVLLLPLRAAQAEQKPVLLFGLGLHIEPMGVTAQGFRSGSQGDYWNGAYFAQHVENIRALAAIVERHGGRMTIQAQSPFTQVAGWTSIYYEIENGQRGNPLPPPWNLAAPDPSHVRPAAEQEAIWAAYEELVAYAAAHLEVVTSDDVVRLARAAGGADTKD